LSNPTNTSPLYLASQSLSRQELLRLAGIPFELISHTSDECVVGPADFEGHVQAVARDKMSCTTLPESAKTYDQVFVMTADTLVQTCDTKELLGKPTDRDDARRMLTLLHREDARVVTAVCLAKQAWRNNAWQLLGQQECCVGANISFKVEPHEIETYLAQEPHALHAAGSAVIERVGLRHLKSLDGSFTAVLGLPLYQVSALLDAMGFFNRAVD